MTERTDITPILVDEERRAILEATARTHALRRTSPKGGPFLGTCIQCGEENLPSSAALKPCPNQRGLTQDDALFEVIEDEEQP